MVEILNTVITVTANAHNPSILHPSFLATQHIVPADWELAEDPVCTPALSLVKFNNGIVIMVEPKKLQVIDNAPPRDPSTSSVPGIVERYTQILPHVRHTALGINLSGFHETAEGDRVLGEFLAVGPWNTGGRHPSSIGVRFVYDALGTRLRLAFDAGRIANEETGEERSGVVIAANYHMNIEGEQNVAAVGLAARRFADCYRHFEDTANAILHSENHHAAR